MSSSSAIADGLVTMLSAASVFGPNMVTKDTYDVLERASGSCAVVSFFSVESEVVAFQNDRERSWTMLVSMYLKDTNDVEALGRRVYTAVDTVITCLDADDTIQGTVSRTDSITMNKVPERAVEAGGFIWLPVELRIRMTEL